MRRCEARLDTTVILPEVRIEVARLAAGSLPVARTSFGAQVISREVLRERGFYTVSDALQQLAGVSAADEVGSPVQPGLSMRGFSVSRVVGTPRELAYL